MRCGKPANVSLVLVGLQQVGIVGLREALRKAEESGVTDPEAVTDFIIEQLATDNYVPDSQMKDYRRAIQREFLRSRGQDIRAFHSEVEITVRGAEGALRERFVETLRSVFGDFELTPKVTYVTPSGEDATPELLIEGEAVVRGNLPRERFKAAVRRRISEW